MSETKGGDEVFKEALFVYAGERTLVGDRLGFMIRWLNEDDTLGDTFHFTSRNFSAVLGCVYSGASHSETSVRGLRAAKYERRWANADSATVIEWDVKSRQAREDDKSRKIEKNQKQRNGIDEAMLPMRILYQAARRRGDYDFSNALERAIISSLHRPVKS